MADVRITDDERRRRAVARHHLARTGDRVAEVVDDLVALHSTDPATPYLSCQARIDGFVRADLAGALHDDRSLWRLHAMRRTLFVVTRGLAPVVQAAAGDEVARRERARTLGWIGATVGEDRAAAWTAAREQAVLDTLAAGDELTTTELGQAVPELRTPIQVGSGRWSTEQPALPRVLYLLAMEGRIVRTRPAGSWRSGQYAWARTDTWFADRLPERIDDEAVARARLLTRYLARLGPATRTDIRWWAGWRARDTDAALAAIEAVTVGLDDDGEGYVLPDDVGSTPPADAPSVALLPALDPTPMGWKERDWFLGDHAGPLFDRNGNVGPTVWLDGRIVGGWGQRPDGEVAVELLEDVGAVATESVAAEAAGLTAWLDGTVVTPRFRTPLERELRDR